MRRYKAYATVKIIIDAKNHIEFVDVLNEMGYHFNHNQIVDYEITDFDYEDEGCEIHGSDDNEPDDLEN